jgi:hypothetical protein
MGLLGRLNPYVLWLKLAVAAAALVGAAYLGGQWVHRGCEAGKTAALREAATAYKASVDSMKAAIEAQRGINDDVVAKNQALKAKLEVSNTQRRKEIKDATERYISRDGTVVAQPPAVFTVEFGRVWNSASERANGRVPAAPEDSPGAADPDLRASTIDRDALLTNHDDAMKQCGKWKADLDSIREWDAKTFVETN